VSNRALLILIIVLVAAFAIAAWLDLVG